jgi:chromatin structure-remodeling complex subunit RSC1/2
VGVTLSDRGVVHSMENESEPSQTQPAPEEPVKSIEDDGKGDSSATSGVTDEQWRSMMDVVLAIYEFREEE